MRLTLLLFILTFSFSSFSQVSTLTAKLISDENQSPLEFATVILKSETSAESKVLGGKTNDKGIVTIKNIPFGTYTVTFSSIGYTTQTQTKVVINALEKKLGTIALLSNSKSLKDVVVKGVKNGVEMGIDKKTFNVEQNITSAGGTAEDILKNVPSVNVDMDGNLSLRGKSNVTLLVDGKPSSMFGNDPQTALQSIPASSIESIEVITNPSSKYEAQGMNGIINIILKKDRKPGYNGMITIGGSIPYRMNGALNLNAKTGKWNVFFNANARTARTWEETTNKRDNYDNNLTYSSFAHNDRRPLSGFINMGAEYEINKKNKITLSENIFNANSKGDVTTTIQNQMNYTTPISTTVRTNQYVGKPLSSTTNLQYKHQGKIPKEELNVELNFSKTQYKRVSDFATRIYDSNNVLTSGFDQSNPILGGNWNGTFQLDYTKPIGKNARIDAGERSYYIKFKSENQPTIQYLNQEIMAETILKNKFDFTQQVHGAYVNIANQFNKTGVQIGLRGEYFSYDGIVYQYNAKVNNNYLNLFPTLFINQKINEHEDLNFNYSRRVNRPNFFQLIPYIDVSNPQDTSMGNPNLKPEFIHSTEVSYNNAYSKNSNILASVYFQYTNNLIQKYRRFNDNGTTFSQNQNLSSAYTYGLELTNRMNILSWWDFTTNVNVFRNNINGANVETQLTKTGFGGFGKIMTNAKLKYGFNAQVTANYFAKTVVAQGEIEPYGNVDIALKKSFYKNLASLTFTVNDVFNTLQTQTNYSLIPYYNQTVLRKNLTRFFGLNLQVKFASKSLRNNADAMKRPQTKKEKEKEAKSRDENLKKDDGGDDGGNR